VTTVSEEAREGSAPAAEQVPGITAGAGAQARASVPPAALLPSEAVTQRARALHRVLARTAEFLDRPESLVHHHPPTFARARERHHEAARRHTTVPLFAGLRLTWGYLHLLLIKPALNLLEWVTETPLRLSAVVILCVIIWIGS
jgi:hypothetical protein